MDTLMQEPWRRAYRPSPPPLPLARYSTQKRAGGAPSERMRVWGTKTEKASGLLGVARAAVAGASRDELLKEALRALGRAGNADRIGVWVEAGSSLSLQSEGPGRFQGLVWDRENGEMPAEWAHLSVEPPLPEESLFAGKSVELHLEADPQRPIIGPLVELRRATWIPIERNGQLKGVILAGSRGKQAVMRLGEMQAIAAELALAIGLEEEQRLARIRNADLRTARNVLEARRTRNPAGMMLAKLADSCTEKGTGEEGQLLGTLVAGLPRRAISLATLERLELRAALAAAELGRRKRNEKEVREAEWQQALLDSSSEAVILLDEAGRIAGSSRGGRELTGLASSGEEKSPASIRAGEQFTSLFRMGSRERIEEWMRGTLDGGRGLRSGREDSPQAELCNGICVRLRIAGPAPGRGLAILLEPLESHEAARQADRAETELQSVLEWMEEGVVLFDAQENVRAMNTRFEQIAGLGPADSGKIKTLEALIERLAEHAASPERFAEHWRKLARGLESGVREELQMARLAPRIVERASRPVLDAAGRQLGRVEIFRDLTAQRVFQSKLLQTEKLAALGQMVSGIAHELSNPLTSILGFAQRLL